MKEQFRFECIKLIRSPLYLFLFLLLIGGFFMELPVLKADYLLYTKDQAYEKVLDQLASDQVSYNTSLETVALLPEENREAATATYQAILNYDEKLIKLFKKTDESAINQVLYEQLSDPVLNYRESGTSVGGTLEIQNDLVQKKLNQTPALSEHTRALNLLATMFKLPNFAASNYVGFQRKSDFDFLWLLLAFAAIVLGLYFSQEKKQHTKNFINTLPFSKTQYLLLQGSFISLLLLLMILVATCLFTVILAFNPNFGLGSLAYPYIKILPQGQTIILTIGQYFLQYFGFLALWIFFLTSLALFLTRFSGDPQTVSSLLILFIFTKPMGVADILAASKIGPYLPTTYLQYSDLLLNRGRYAQIPVQTGIIVLVGWSLVLFALTLAIVHKRKKV